MTRRAPRGYRVNGIAAFAATILLASGGFALAGTLPTASAATPEKATTGSLSAAETLALVEKANTAVDEWDIITAGEAADALEKGNSEGVDSMMMRSFVRFHQGRYAESIKLLDSLKSKGRREEKNDTLTVMRETAIITRNFVEKKGVHFTIKYRPGPDAILADWALETLEAQRAALEQDLGYAPPENVPVEIFPTADNFAVVTTLTREQIETTGTIALCKFNKLMVTTPGALSNGYAWRDTLAHEYTHYVIARSTKNKVPIWLHEGLAKYEEVRWRRATGGEHSPTVESVLAEGLAKDAQGKDHFVPFHKMHPSIAMLPTAFEATLAFAEVESLIGFCVEDWKYDGIRTLLTGLRDGKPMDVALLGAFGVGLDGLQEKWREYIAANPPKLHPDLQLMPMALKDPKADADASGASHKGISDDASDHLRLGDLLAGEARVDAAIVEFRKAKDAERLASTKSGHGPIFDYKIAATLIAANRWADAKKALAPVLDTYPTYAPALKAAGRIELAVGDPKKAREYFEKSLWQAPFDMEVYALSAEACTKSNDKAGADRYEGLHDSLDRLVRKSEGLAPADSTHSNEQEKENVIR